MCVKVGVTQLPLNIALIKAAVSFPFRAEFVIIAVSCSKRKF